MTRIPKGPTQLPPARTGTAPLPSPFLLEGGDTLEEGRVGFEEIGNPEGPVIVVLGGISADGHPCASARSAEPGWWPLMVGPGRPLDTRRARIIGMDWIGGPGASSAPARSPGAASIPMVTTADQARGLGAVLDHLGIERTHAVVGASYGAMVALAFGALLPERARRIVAISGAHRSHPMATALRSLQRDVALFGERTGRPREGLVLARALAMTTYRTAGEFEGRFPMEPEVTEGRIRFPVEGYLRHHGEGFADRFTPDHFLTLCQSLDLHRVEPSEIAVPTTLVAVEEDALVPLWQMQALHAELPEPTPLVRFSSPRGHDAFLTDEEPLGGVLASLVEEGAR